MKTVIVTGHKGFIGSCFWEYCKRHLDDSKYFGVDKKGCSYIDKYKEEDSCIGASFEDAVFDIVQNNNVDIIYHFAATPGVHSSYQECLKNNVEKVSELIHICKRNNIKLVFISSSCAYEPNMTSSYGISKRYGEMLCKTLLPEHSVVLRLHNVYAKNSRSKTLPHILKNFDNIRVYNNGNNTRHFTYIDDIIPLIYKYGYTNTGMYNIANPEESTLRDFVDEYLKYDNKNIMYIDSKIQDDCCHQTIDNRYENLLEIDGNKCTSLKNGVRIMASNA